MTSQEAVCLGQSWPGIRPLTSGPASSHSGNTSLGASSTQGGESSVQPQTEEGPAREAGQPDSQSSLGCCI